MPDGLSLEEAAGIPIEFGTADDCLFEFGHLSRGETVLVQAGAGGVGLAAIQLAKAAGATVLATASSDDRLNRLHDFGMDHGINYAHRRRRRRGAAGSPSGAASTWSSTPSAARRSRAASPSLAYRGRVSWVGRAGREERPPEVWPLMQKNASITGVFLGAEMAVNPDRVRAMIELAHRTGGVGRAEGRDRPMFPLAEAAEAHRYIESRQAFGRVLLIP